MIPILFPSTATTFTSNGLGRLADAISCTVEEERNGPYELEMRYPMTGRHYREITDGSIIVARHSDKLDLQPFRVYKISRPLNGVVTVFARHLSYDLNKLVVLPFVEPSLTQLFLNLPSHSVTACPFTFETDKAVLTEFSVSEPMQMRAILGGSENSILDIYGGEYEFDGYRVILHNNRGTDNGVTIRYGKNLTEMVHESDGSGSVTAVVPFWKGTGTNGEETTVYATEPVYSGVGYTVPYTNEASTEYNDSGGEVYEGVITPTIVETLDLSQDFETQPTVEQLTEAAEQWLEAHATVIPDENIRLSFVQLWQTNEYKNYAPLQRVGLCDTVTVEYARLGVSATTKVIKTVYNVLLERFDSMELGAPRSTLASTIVKAEQAAEGVSDEIASAKTAMEIAIEHATELLSGGLGGHVIISTNADGEPNEILIMDTDSISTAMNVLRLNMNGIGFSSSGYEGPYATAWTIDGRFVADYITAGTLKAITIEGPTSQTFWDLATGIFQSYGTKTLTSTIRTGWSTTETVTYTVESKTRLDGGELTVEGKKTTDTEDTEFTDIGLQSDDIDYDFYQQIPDDIPHTSLAYPHGGMVARGDRVTSFGGTGVDQAAADVDTIKYRPTGVLTPDYLQLGEAGDPVYTDGTAYDKIADRNVLRLSGGWAERRESIMYIENCTHEYNYQGDIRTFRNPPIINRPAWEVSLSDFLYQDGGFLTVGWITTNKTKLQLFFPFVRPVGEDVLGLEFDFVLHRAYTASGTGVVTSDQNCWMGSGELEVREVTWGDLGARVIVENVNAPSWSAASNNGMVFCEIYDLVIRPRDYDPYAEE